VRLDSAQHKTVLHDAASIKRMHQYKKSILPLSKMYLFIYPFLALLYLFTACNIGLIKHNTVWEVRYKVRDSMHNIKWQIMYKSWPVN
jgi:hypothetical protein